MGPFSFSTRSSVEGLYHCGASTFSHGVAGAAISGLLAAQKIADVERYEDLLGPADGSLRVYPSEHPETWATDHAARARGDAAERILEAAGGLEPGASGGAEELDEVA
jgi:all-trans-retinol 13,14-reductase